MISYWERESFLEYDYLIVGGGIVGMSTAASLAEQDPDARILVIEKGTLPTGASTKNAGFACFGSITEILDDLKVMSEEEVLELVKMRWNGLQKFRKRLSNYPDWFSPTGGYELISDTDAEALSALDRINALLYPVFGQRVFAVRDDLIPEMGFNQDKVSHLVFNPLEGQINTGKAIWSLWDYCSRLGIKFMQGTSVTTITDNGLMAGELHFKGKVLVCTNAFTKTLVPGVEMEPGRGQVLITEPLEKPLSFNGVFHYDKGYFYFRNVGSDRLLIGGARNLFRDDETTTQFEVTDQVQEAIEDLVREVIIPDQSYKVDMRWSGIMAFGNTKQPIIQKYNGNTYLGVRLGGMGVAIGSYLGEQLAALVKNDAHE